MIHGGREGRLRLLPKHSDVTSLLSLGWVDESSVVGKFAGLEAERGIVNGTKLEEEEQEEYGAGDNIEDAVPNHLRGRRDDIAALRESPADRISKEHERQEGRRLDVALAESTGSRECRTGTVPEEHVPNDRRT